MKFKKCSAIILLTLIVQIGFSQSDVIETEKFSRADTLRGALSAERLCYILGDTRRLKFAAHGSRE